MGNAWRYLLLAVVASSSAAFKVPLSSIRRRELLQLVTVPLLTCSAPARGILPLSGTGAILDAAVRNSQVTYSSNAINFARLNSGDSSGGSTYVALSPAGAKRRAVQGCKIEAVRRDAGLDEADCIRKVFGGETKFVLDILEQRECTTCAYGVKQ